MMRWQDNANQEHFGRSPRWPWVAALAAITVGGVIVLVATRGGPEEVPEPIAEPIPLVALEQGAEAEPAAPLPAVRETDAVVRELLGELLPLVGARDLVRRFVSAVNQIADGENPRAQLELLAPGEGRFRARERKGQLVVDERSHRRYDAVGDLVGALDATRMAAVFRELEPILDHTHEELGARNRTFRETLALAIDRLVRTPIPDGPMRLRRDRMFYAFADPSLDRLSAAQQQLLRMGPRNARVVQSSLRELAAALELPPVEQHARLHGPH